MTLKIYSRPDTDDIEGIEKKHYKSMKVMKNDTGIIVSIQYGMTYLGIMKTLDEILKTD
jgi:hypothetical protein